MRKKLTAIGRWNHVLRPLNGLDPPPNPVGEQKDVADAFDTIAGYLDEMWEDHKKGDGKGYIAFGEAETRMAMLRANAIPNARKGLAEIAARFAPDQPDAIALLAQNIVSAIYLGISLGAHVEWTHQLLAREKEKTEAKRKLGSAGGKKSGETRRNDRRWVIHAKELALVIREEAKCTSYSAEARDVLDRWKDGSVDPPHSHRTIEDFLKELDKTGEISPRRAKK
jgi:hypothetical protein